MQSHDNSFDEESTDAPNVDSGSWWNSLKESKVKYLIILGFIVAIIGLWMWSSRGNALRQEQEKWSFDLTPVQLPTSQRREPSQNYKEAIEAKTELIKKIQNSFKEYECLNLTPLFHSYDYTHFIMYLTTYDELILPGCLNVFNHKWSVARENINVWNENREVTEWALQHVQQGDKVLYYRPKVFNLAETTILSKLVGPNGRLVIIDSMQSRHCMPNILQFHSLSDNVEYYENELSSISGKYDVLIGNDTVFKYKVKEDLADDSKMLIYSTNINSLTSDFTEHKIDTFKLESKECGRGVYGGLSDAADGYFSFTTVGVPIPERKVFKRNAAPAENKILAAIEQQYFSYKMQYMNKEVAERERLKMYDQKRICIKPNSNRQGQGYVITTYGHKLYGVSLKQLQQWERKREAVQWIRPKTSFIDVYYEVKHDFNLLAIVEIAHLITDGTLYVVCSEEEWGKIEQQFSKSKLNNVVKLDQTSTKQALLAGAIITDNEVLIKEVLATNYDKDHSLLGHFTHTRNESLNAMREIYVQHRLKEIYLPQPAKQCAGFEFLHFFWNSSHPDNFYEITPSKYVVYSYWGGPPEQTPQRKSFIIKEIATTDVQFKILTQQLFLFFQTKENPIHPAFYLLTSIQKSDFVRFYMMQNYGGGYADVKHYHFDWAPFFQRMEKDEVRLAYGYPELHDYDVGCHDDEGLVPKCRVIRDAHKRIIGNTHYIFKKDSALTRDWYHAAITNLDNKLEDLRKNPPQVPRENWNHEFTLKNGTKFISKYPFRWAEIANQHLGRLVYKYRDVVATDMPYVITEDYRTESNLDEN